MIEQLISELQTAQKFKIHLEKLEEISKNVFFQEEDFNRYYGHEKDARKRIGKYLVSELNKIIEDIKK